MAMTFGGLASLSTKLGATGADNQPQNLIGSLIQTKKKTQNTYELTNRIGELGIANAIKKGGGMLNGSLAGGSKQGSGILSTKV